MRRTVSAKLLAPQVSLRRSPVTASQASRRPFPAWIAADEGGAAFPATSVTPRVRSALVLRQVGKNKSSQSKGASDDSGAR
jgi:hypothetical protein